MKRYVLDSHAVMAWMEDEPGALVTEEILKAAEGGKAECLFCTINWGEVFYILLRESGNELADNYLEKMSKLPVKLIDPDQALVLQAATYKAKYRFSYADAFVAATAKLYQAEVVTGDPEFEGLKKEVKIKWIR